MSPAILALFQFSIIAYALVGGVFLAFSDFVMRSLARTGGVGGVEAMQVINREVFRWVFMTLFLGMAAISVFIAIYAVVNLTGGPATIILLGAIIYLLGCFAVTVFCNVPMNAALAGMDLSSDATKDYWSGIYMPRWTMWNTIRTIACIVSAALMLIGLTWLPQTELKQGLISDDRLPHSSASISHDNRHINAKSPRTGAFARHQR
ncbi:anthrone oxygenase family protein [Yoonia sp. 2307UL14-13]|uniref:anthrone oxygenase family protein n=1 Tax=Yoonia sp. 2307UL14-13 TaxID=3126506 RepID=UPI00309C021D